MGRLALVVCLVLIAVVAWANAPARYRAHLDPPGLEITEFHNGRLMGWYVYVYVDGKRVVCANPTVWDGPKVVTCNYVVAIEPKGEMP